MAVRSPWGEGQGEGGSNSTRFNPGMNDVQPFRMNHMHMCLTGSGHKIINSFGVF